MSKQIIIRHVTRHDTQTIALLNEELKNERHSLFSPYNKLFHKKIQAKNTTPVPAPKRLLLTKKDIALCAETTDRQIVGFIWGTMHDRKGRALSKLGSIEELIIAKSFRRQGIAQKLFKQLVAEFK